MALVFPGGSDGKESACSADSQVQALGWENPLEKEMATHSSILAWKSPWMEEFGRLQSMESQSQTLCLTTTCLFASLWPNSLPQRGLTVWLTGLRLSSSLMPDSRTH